MPPKHWAKVQQVTGIPPEEFETWELLGPPEQEPASEERPAFAPRELGTTLEELWETVAGIDSDLQSKGITVSQRTGLRKARSSALSSIARLEERQAIHEHPDYGPLVEDLVTAVVVELGPNAPDGIEARIADRLEALQVQRGVAPRKAAA